MTAIIEREKQLYNFNNIIKLQNSIFFAQVS